MMQDKIKSKELLQLESSFLLCKCKKQQEFSLLHAICIQTLFFSGCVIISSMALKFSAIIYVLYYTLINFENLKNHPQILLFCSLEIGIETGSVNQP